MKGFLAAITFLLGGTLTQGSPGNKSQNFNDSDILSIFLNLCIDTADTFDNLPAVGSRRGKMGNWGKQEA